ncbi:hypothetical protein DB346_01485 [Verrucomicrobia bacterium LW23]|nr:hypothetical protein DB346_01485 [Verrucomicrobia bacterium LW23]
MASSLAIMSLQPLVVKAGTARPFSPIGHDASYCIADGAATAGNYAFVEQTVPPGEGPPLHLHTREEEGFYIIAGEITFVVADKTIVAGPGDFVLGPRNIPHRFYNSGNVPAKYVMVISPAGFEHFLTEYGDLIASDPTNKAAIVALGDKYGLQFL